MKVKVKIPPHSISFSMKQPWSIQSKNNSQFFIKSNKKFWPFFSRRHDTQHKEQSAYGIWHKWHSAQQHCNNVEFQILFVVMRSAVAPFSTNFKLILRQIFKSSFSTYWLYKKVLNSMKRSMWSWFEKKCDK